MRLHLQVAPDIELRQVQLADADALFALTQRNRDYLREWLPWVDNTSSADDTRNFILGAQAQFEAGRGPSAVILVCGAIAGSLGCHPIDWANRSCSIGYWVDASLQRKGVVTRSTQRLIDYLFGEVRLHRVVIQCGTGNQKSCAIPQRLGFTREGVLWEAEWVSGRWVDLVVWSMLEQNWRK